jgi:hypothetical protein
MQQLERASLISSLRAHFAGKRHHATGEVEIELTQPKKGSKWNGFQLLPGTSFKVLGWSSEGSSPCARVFRMLSIAAGGCRMFAFSNSSVRCGKE